MINIKVITTDMVMIVMPSWFMYTMLACVMADVIWDIVLWVQRVRLKKLLMQENKPEAAHE
jgi:hypothetical protein